VTNTGRVGNAAVDRDESAMNARSAPLDTCVQSPPYVTVSAFARAIGASPRTVRWWCETQQIAAARTPGGHYRIPRVELERRRPQGRAQQAAA